jgi:hypothetical protein
LCQLVVAHRLRLSMHRHLANEPALMTVVAAPTPPVAKVSTPKAAVAAPAPVAMAKAPHDDPFHLPGIVIEIVGMEMNDQGCSCEDVNNARYWLYH